MQIVINDDFFSQYVIVHIVDALKRATFQQINYVNRLKKLEKTQRDSTTNTNRKYFRSAILKGTHT